MTRDCGKPSVCIATQVAVEQTKQNNEWHDKLRDMSSEFKEASLSFSENFKEFSGNFADFRLQLSEIKPIMRELADFKEDNKEAHDFFGEQLRKHEAFKAEKQELIKLESELKKNIETISSERTSWKTKIIFAGVTVTLAMVMFMAGHFIK